MSMVQVKEFGPPPVNEKEILRYARCPRANEATLSLMRQCLAEAEGELAFRVCWETVPCHVEGKVCHLGALDVASRDLARNLQGCREAVLFAATVGMGVDRLIRKYQRLSPAKAMMLQAVGAERVESLCDAFCDGLEESGRQWRPRFSPGYGDVSLAVQRDFFALLQCEKHLGIYLNESLLMSPSKSVTAFVGRME